MPLKRVPATNSASVRVGVIKTIAEASAAVRQKVDRDGLPPCFRYLSNPATARMGLAVPAPISKETMNRNRPLPITCPTIHRINVCDASLGTGKMRLETRLTLRSGVTASTQT